MANYMTNDTDLTTVANAIRAKGGTSASIEFPSGFAAAIAAIPTGGGEIPQGWAAAEDSYYVRDNTVGATFDFGDVNIDPDNCIFFMWSVNTSGTYTRVSAGYFKFDGITPFHTMQNLTSSGTLNASALLNSTEFNVTTAAGVTFVDVTYVNTRKFKLGSTYNAIIIGKVNS